MPRIARRKGPDRSRVARAPEPLETRRVPATFTVSSLADAGPGTLRDAVERANDAAGADTIRFAPGLSGAIVLTTGELTLEGTLSIDGPGAARLAVSGAGQSRIFSLAGPQTRVTIDDLTLTDGRATVVDPVGPGLVRGGAIRNDGGRLVLARVAFTSNRAESDPGQPGAAGIVGGGAVVNSGAATLAATDCTFTGNTASGGTRYAFGGAIANVTGSRATLVRCTFTGNTASGGAANHGGAVGNFGSSTLVVQGGRFAGNEARGDGAAPASGGAIATRPGTVSTTGSVTRIAAAVFLGNTAAGGAGGGSAAGGALDCTDSSLTVGGARFTANRAVAGASALASGGAVAATSLFGDAVPTTRLVGCLLASNQAVGGVGGAAFGGACASAEGVMAIDGTTFVANVARLPAGSLPAPASDAAGGAIAVGPPRGANAEAAATLLLRGSTVARNEAVAADAAGGGLFVATPPSGPPPVVRIVTSRFVGNTPRGPGRVSG